LSPPEELELLELSTSTVSKRPRPTHMRRSEAALGVMMIVKGGLRNACTITSK